MLYYVLRYLCIFYIEPGLRTKAPTFNMFQTLSIMLHNQTIIRPSIICIILYIYLRRLKYSYLVYLEPIGTKYDQGSDLFRGRALLRRGLKCFLYSCYRRYQTNYMFLYHVVFYTRFLTL